MGIGFYFKRIKSDSVTRFVNTAKTVSERTGKPWPGILVDILWCMALYGSGHVDYREFEMYNMNHKERKNVLTIAKNNKIVKKYNDFTYTQFFDDKALFYKKFEKYLKREWMLIGEGVKYTEYPGTHVTEDDIVIGQGVEAFKKFIFDKEYVMVKPLDLSCGKGIEKLKVSEWDPQELYDRLLKNRTPMVEEVVKQNETMNLLCSTAVNTIRLVTLVRDNKPYVVAGSIRMGAKGAIVDNFNHGGISTIYNLETGELMCDGYNKMREVVKTVPENGIQIKGFQTPMHDEAIAIVKQAAMEIPQVGYVAWDVCLSAEKGALLIEGNNFPGPDTTQRIDLDAGTMNAYRRALGLKENEKFY